MVHMRRRLGWRGKVNQKDDVISPKNNSKTEPSKTSVRRCKKTVEEVSTSKNKKVTVVISLGTELRNTETSTKKVKLSIQSFVSGYQLTQELCTFFQWNFGSLGTDSTWNILFELRLWNLRSRVRTSTKPSWLYWSLSRHRYTCGRYHNGTKENKKIKHND